MGFIGSRQPENGDSALGKIKSRLEVRSHQFALGLREVRADT